MDIIKNKFINTKNHNTDEKIKSISFRNKLFKDIIKDIKKLLLKEFYYYILIIISIYIGIIILLFIIIIMLLNTNKK